MICSVLLSSALFAPVFPTETTTSVQDALVATDTTTMHHPPSSTNASATSQPSSNGAAQRMVYPSVRTSSSDFSAAQREFWAARSLWQFSLNAAGLAFDALPLQARGESGFSFARSAGTLRTLPQGDAQQVGAFHARQQLPIGRWLAAQGEFAYGLSRFDNRAWNDRSDNSELSPLSSATSPFQLPFGLSTRTHLGVNAPADLTSSGTLSPLNAGSDRLGRYDAQTVDMGFRIATLQPGAWNFGLAAVYAVNDLARLKDPRSRAQQLYYRLAPSAIWHNDALQVGAAAWYARRKEKIGNITSVQQDAQWNYYTLEGLEHLTGGAGAAQGFMRQWVNHNYGGQLAFGAQLPQLQLLFTLSGEGNHEEAVGNYRYTPASFRSERWQLQSLGLAQHGDWWHTWRNSVAWQRGFSHEHQQQLVLTTDPETKIVSRHYETVLDFHKRYQAEQVNALISYRALHTNSEATATRTPALSDEWQRGIDGSVGFSLRYDYLSQRYLLPTSQRAVHRLSPTLEGGRLWGNAVWVQLEVGASLPLQHRLEMTSSQRPLRALWQSQARLDASTLGHASLSARYDWRMAIHRQSLRFFARAAATYTRAFEEQLHTTAFSLTLGLLH